MKKGFTNVLVVNIMYPSYDDTPSIVKGEQMAKFKKCPRCELNYIPIEEDYCSICKEELKGLLVEDIEEDDEEEGLCPRCRTNYVNDGEKYCERCLQEMEAEKEKSSDDLFWEEEPEEDGMNDDDLIDDMLDDADIASLGELADEEFEDDYDEDEESEPDYIEEDDFESVSPDDYDEDEDEDFEDEEEAFEDDED